MQPPNKSAKLKNSPNELQQKEWSINLADVIENSSQPFVSICHDGKFIYFNNAFCDLLGYRKEELQNLTWINLTLPEWLDCTEDIIKKLNETGETQRYQKRIFRKDGTRIPVELLAHCVNDSDSEVYYNVFLTDVSERKELEAGTMQHQENLEQLVRRRTVELENTIKQLSEINQRVILSEERFKLIFNFCPIPFFLTTFDKGKIIDCNKSFLETLGYRFDEVIGKRAVDLALWPNLKEREVFYRILNECGSVNNLEVQIRNKLGKIHQGLISTAKINIENENCLLSLIVDISEKKNFEKEIMRLDKLDLIGQMASGIAHEVRNPLTSVKGFLQLLGNKETDNKKKEYYDLMIDELDRANSIITDFLSLAKDRAIELKPASLNIVINGLLPILSTDALRQGNRIIFEQGDLPKMLINEKEIRQLIFNLVRNGLEAMPSGVDLTIGTYVENDEVVLFVKDEGFGINSYILEKIGTPFLTTKDNGTGLGLSVCYGIAARHDAKIDFKTGPTGTTFYVRFKIPQSKIEVIS